MALSGFVVPLSAIARTIVRLQSDSLSGFVGIRSSDEGGRRAAAIYSIVESARLSGLDPNAYLADVIDKMAKGWPRSRLADLLPWQWKAARAAAESAAAPAPIIEAA